MGADGHAYLIIAHNEFELLRHIIKALDDDRNDIYIHIDKKVENVDLNQLKQQAVKSGLYFAERVKVFWGHHSMIECEFNLMSMALANGPYEYYHLMSGVDFPIKSQDYIHDVLRGSNKQYVTCWKNMTDVEDERNYSYKIDYFYFFMRWSGRHFGDGSSIVTRLDRKLVRIQKRINFKRTLFYPEIEFYKGDQWFSITEDFVKYILSKKKWIRRAFRWTNGPDEFFIPTLAMNSNFKDRIENNCMRIIDWTRGAPYEFRSCDIDEIRKSDRFFVRKVSYERDNLLIKKLEDMIKR